MLRIGTAAFLLALATSASAQTTSKAPPAPAPANMPPSPEFIQAAQAFGQCVGPRVRANPSLTPEAAADAALKACASEQATVERTFESWLASVPGTDAQKAAARAQMRSQLDGARADIVAAIRTARAAPPTATPPKK